MSKAVADYQGTILKRLGDGAMAIFTTATDAIAAGATIQTRLAREAHTQAASMHVRIGISAGEVVLEESDVRGLPPTEAARLSARAEGGQILTPSSSTSSPGAQRGPLPSARCVRSEGPPRPDAALRSVLADQRRRNGPAPESLDLAAHEFAFVGRTREVAVLVEQWTKPRDERAVVGHRDGRSGRREVAARRRVRPFARSRCSHRSVRPL